MLGFPSSHLEALSLHLAPLLLYSARLLFAMCKLVVVGLILVRRELTLGRGNDNMSEAAHPCA